MDIDNCVSLKRFVSSILSTLSIDESAFEIEIYEARFFNKKTIVASREYIVYVKGDANDCLIKKLSRFLSKTINVIDDGFYWEEGECINNNTLCCVPSAERQNIVNIHNLPTWLEDFIYNELNAIYSPDYIRYEYNLDLDKEELKVYLGTYFPRSFVEANVLLQMLCENTLYTDSIKDMDTISILDLGCGSGGEIIGALYFIENQILHIKKVQILAIDGNHGALRIFESVIKEYKKHSRLNISYRVGPAFIGNSEDLEVMTSIMSTEYDFILSFKAICELVAKNRIKSNAYEYCANMLAPKLSSCGIMLFVDVTVKKETINQFLPVYMNVGLNKFIRESVGKYKTILPNNCKINGERCFDGCFFKETIDVNHKKKSNDLTKISYRFIGKTSFVDKISESSKGNFIDCKYN